MDAVLHELKSRRSETSLPRMKDISTEKKMLKTSSTSSLPHFSPLPTLGSSGGNNTSTTGSKRKASNPHLSLSGVSTSQGTNRTSPRPQSLAAIPSYPTENLTLIGNGSGASMTGSGGSNEGASRIDQERLEIIKEIILTEWHYIEDLCVVVNCFIDPIKQHKILSKIEIESIFSNISSIKDFHMQLKSSLPDNHPSWSELGSLFIKSFSSLANFLKLYQVYSSAYKSIIERVTKLEKENEKFANFLKDAQSLPECKKLNLQDFLIKPIQRLCKYPLFFQSLLKVTPLEHADYKLVVDTCERVNQLAESVNEHAAEIMNVERLNYFNSIVSGYAVQFTSDWYIRDSVLLLEEERGEKLPKHLWLLSNALIISRPSKMRKKEKFLRKIDLVEDISLELGDENDFEIVVGEEESYRFLCSSSVLRAQWVTDINNLLKDKDSQLKSPRNPLLVINTEEIKSLPSKTRKLRKRISLKKTPTPPSQHNNKRGGGAGGAGAGSGAGSGSGSGAVAGGGGGAVAVAGAGAVAVAVAVGGGRKSTEEDLEPLSPISIINTASTSSGGPDRRKIERTISSSSRRPDGSAQAALEITQLREEVALFREEKERWMKRESELLERIRFLESQLFQVMSPVQKEDDFAGEYYQVANSLRLILLKMDGFVDTMKGKENKGNG